MIQALDSQGLMVVPVRRTWDPEDLFGQMQADEYRVLEADREATWAKLWKDLYTEYDARHLEVELDRRRIVVSPEGRAFMDAWSADERRHTRGFVRLMELLVGADGQELCNSLDARAHDFGRIEDFLKDEFTALLMIAFDEMVTCHAYAQDRDFYRAAGGAPFTRWLSELMADEAAHCRNAVEVIRALHSDRIDEVQPILQNLLHGVGEASDYGGTFVFDHFGEHYSDEMLGSCEAALIRAISRPFARSH